MPPRRYIVTATHQAHGLSRSLLPQNTADDGSAFGAFSGGAVGRDARAALCVRPLAGSAGPGVPRAAVADCVSGIKGSNASQRADGAAAEAWRRGGRRQARRLAGRWLKPPSCGWLTLGGGSCRLPASSSVRVPRSCGGDISAMYAGAACVANPQPAPCVCAHVYARGIIRARVRQSPNRSRARAGVCVSGCGGGSWLRARYVAA